MELLKSQGEHRKFRVVFMYRMWGLNRSETICKKIFVRVKRVGWSIRKASSEIGTLLAL